MPGSFKNSNPNIKCAALKALRNAGVVAINVTMWNEVAFYEKVFLIIGVVHEQQVLTV